MSFSIETIRAQAQAQANIYKTTMVIYRRPRGEYIIARLGTLQDVLNSFSIQEQVVEVAVVQPK